jgi:hypothetical protein
LTGAEGVSQAVFDLIHETLRQGRKPGLKREDGLFRRHFLQEQTGKDLLVEGAQASHALENPLPADVAVPIHAQIAYDRPQPGGKGRFSFGAEAPQPAKLLLAQLLAHKQKAVTDMVRISLKQPYDLKNQGGVKV